MSSKNSDVITNLSDIDFDSIEYIEYSEPCSLISEQDKNKIEAVAPIEREQLVKLYRGKNYTVEQLMELLDESKDSITKLLRVYGIYKNDHKYLKRTNTEPIDKIYEDDEQETTIFNTPEENNKKGDTEKKYTFKDIVNSQNDKEGLIPDTDSGMEERIGIDETVEELKKRLKKQKE